MTPGSLSAREPEGSARHEGGCEAPALGAGRALPGGSHRAGRLNCRRPDHPAMRIAEVEK